MKYYIIAGEASGDLHASNLMHSLKEIDINADFRFFGGDLMLKEGGKLVKHYKEMAFMGFIPVLLNLRTIFRNMSLCKQDIELYQPDVVILVDYPGFNLKIAKHIKKTSNIPVYYYISPKIWAWKKWRIKSIRKYIDKMFCILPFEVDFYKKNNYKVEYVGNPSIDSVAYRENKNESFDEFTTSFNLETKPIIAILAGSRKQEIKDNLQAMLEAASGFNDFQMVIAGAPGIDPSYYEIYTKGYNVHIVFNQTYRLLQQSTAALVTSGTATLETGLFKVPQVVCYETPIKHIVSFVFNNFFTVKYISLINLIADKTVVQELFAASFSVRNIKNELDRLLFDEEYKKTMLNNYDQIIKSLGDPGASMHAAKAIYASLTFALAN